MTFTGMTYIDPMLVLLIFGGLLLIIVAFALEPVLELTCPICKKVHKGDEAVEGLEDCIYSHLSFYQQTLPPLETSEKPVSGP